MLSLQTLHYAEKKLPGLLKEVGRWDGRLKQHGASLAEISIWRPLEISNYHVVLQIIDGHSQMEYRLAEQEYVIRVVKGICKFTSGAQFEGDSWESLDGGSQIDKVFELVLAAGSQYHNSDPMAWEHLTPISRECLLTRVCRAESEPIYMEGEALSQRTLEMVVGRFKGIYK